jgi:two-component system alkaline phosphatase synthesis response regulator PhoP
MERPDLVIMDVILPGRINGIEATKILKRNQTTKNCVVLILTGTDDAKLKEKGLRAGATDFFFKPFSPLELLEKIETTLDELTLTD